MPYYGEALPYYYGGPFSNHSSLMTGIGRSLHSPLGSSRYAPHLTTISESPLSALRRYSPAATMVTRPKRVIDTADIDVSTPRALTNTGNNGNQRNRLRRDRPTIRIRSQALKDNPALREHYERHEKTVGELLVEKFLIKDKKTEAEGELRTKLYGQISLENDPETSKKQQDDLQEAMQRRVTRRMTRRRSSADVQMDPEQIEREVAFAQAQADALDSLVAQEQAEIEVETRMGTLIRKNLVRSVGPLIRSKHDGQGLSGDDDDDARTKKLAKKVKKRKKTTDKPSPPSGSELDSEHDETRTNKVPKDTGKETDDKSSRIDEKETINGVDGTMECHTEEDNNVNSVEAPLSPNKAVKFKIEASNSVGDFSTLWINAGVAEENEKQRKISEGIVEQFRDSVRLPAPKQSVEKFAKSNKKDTIIEEHQQIVVLPVKKRYVKDNTRNSVYLTLKTQKSANSNETGGTDDTIDRIEAIDEKIDQSSSSSSSCTPSTAVTNGKAIEEEKLTNMSSIANTTTGIKRQPRLNKVAKFRSKDITESDVEVKSISELPGSGETKEKLVTKDVVLQNLSELNDDTSNVIANESISVSLNRDASVNSTRVLSEDTKNLKVGETRDTDSCTKIDNSKLIISTNKVSSARDDRILAANDGITEKLWEIGVEDKLGKPLKRAKREIKELRKNNSDSIVDESERPKRSVASTLDSSSARLELENLEKRKNEEKEQLGNGTESRTAIISSLVRPSNVVESLPNASTIISSDFEKRLNGTVKISNEELNVTGIEKEEKSIAEIFVENEDLSLSREITEKFAETRGEISKPIVVTSKDREVVELDNLRKVKDERQNVVEQPATRNESSNILTPTRKDVNFGKYENDEKLTVKLTKKTVSCVDATCNDDKNVVESQKLRKNRKILALSSRNNSAESVESSPDTTDLEVVTNDPKKYQTRTKKRLVTATNGDDISSSKLVKPLKDLAKDKAETAIEARIAEDSSRKSIEKLKFTNEPEKLTNGAGNTKTKTSIAVKKLPEPEVNIKITKKVEGGKSSVKKDEEIDFWGEIESQRVAEPSAKIVEKIVQTQKNIEDDSIANTGHSDDISDAMVIILEPEAKSNTSPESGTRDETKTLVGGEKKFNKARKKKTSESSGCKKKDQEKASSKTIFEHFTSPDVLDEKSHQQPEQLEQQSEKLGEKSLLQDSSEEKTCENLEIDRFERNLSTIDEEIPSPVSEDIPKKVEALDLAASSFRKEEEEEEKEVRVKTKLDTTRIFSSLDGDSESGEKISTKDLSPSFPTSLGEPLVPEVEKDVISSKVPIELKNQQIDDTCLKNSEVSVPSINIVEAPSTTLEETILPIVVPEEEPPEDEGEEGPGTPTNETVDDTIKQIPNIISRCHGPPDFSLDEPDKDIGPEVALEEAKKERARKKVCSSKKASKNSSVGSSSTKSTGTSADSSKKKKLAKRKKSSTKNVKDSEKRIDERSESKVSNSSDTTLKPGVPNIRYSPINSESNSPKQRPLDLIKMFYTTPASLLTATPRDLSKVRRAKIKKRKHSSRTASASSDSTGSTRSTQSTGTAESTGSTEHEDDTEQKRISSTRSNDSGFDGSPRLSNCDMACHKKCEKLTGNLCGLNQKLVAEALQSLKRAPSQSSDNQRNSDGSDHHASGRITPPATNLPRFKKYTVMDFNFLKVLGKGSFGKVLLAELRRTDCVYAVKCLKKDVVLEDDDVECTLIERKVLTLATRHPYLCHLFCTFQTDSHLFFVMEYLNGGDLMFHIQKSGRFAETRARFYAAEIWSGLIFLHKKGIVYRDLKLDNVLLDFEGHIRIADFGMCKLQIFLDRTADTFCGTPDYMAPEIIKGLKYNQAVDWWSFGVLLYEMLTGQSPFSGCDEDELFWSICNERPFIPRYLSQEAMDVLICLLEKDAGKRPPGHEIAVHPFFHSLQWDRLERRQLEPPFKPALEHTLDTRYFDTAFTAERPRLTPVPEQILTSMDQGVFRGFSYTNPNATD